MLLMRGRRHCFRLDWGRGPPGWMWITEATATPNVRRSAPWSRDRGATARRAMNWTRCGVFVGWVRTTLRERSCPMVREWIDNHA